MQQITCLLLTIFICKYTSNAQTVEPSKGVNLNNLQIEFEIINAVEKENTSLLQSISTPNLLVRYGITKDIELQFSLPISKENYYENNELVYSTHKFDDAQLGFSVNLWNEKEWIPEAALMTRSYFHYRSNLNFSYVGQTISLNLSNTLSDRFLFNYNFGYAFEKNTEFSSFIIGNLTYNISLKWSVFLEYSANNTLNNTLFQNIATGFSYKINNALNCDFTFAKGLNHNLFYTGGRLTWVINTKPN